MRIRNFSLSIQPHTHIYSETYSLKENSKKRTLNWNLIAWLNFCHLHNKKKREKKEAKRKKAELVCFAFISINSIYFPLRNHIACIDSYYLK